MSPGSVQGMYRVCRLSYRYQAATYNTAFHEIATASKTSTRMLTPANTYQKRADAGQFLSRLMGNSSHSSASASARKGGRPQQQQMAMGKKKRKGKGEVQRDCVSLGELELNSRYLAAPSSFSRNSSSDSSERRPFTLT